MEKPKWVAQDGNSHLHLYLIHFFSVPNKLKQHGNVVAIITCTYFNRLFKATRVVQTKQQGVNTHITRTAPNAADCYHGVHSFLHYISTFHKNIISALCTAISVLSSRNHKAAPGYPCSTPASKNRPKETMTMVSSPSATYKGMNANTNKLAQPTQA